MSRKKEKRLSISRARDIERQSVKPLNDNGVYLRNPEASPAYDKHKPIDSDRKALSFGMEPVSPKRLWDLPPGDAGAGQTVYRRIQIFMPLNNRDAIIGDTGDRFAQYPYTNGLGIASNRSSDQQPQYFHVSMYGIGTTRNDDGVVAGQPLNYAEIIDRQFEQIFIREAGGSVPLTDRYLPSICVTQCRVMVHDESGQRFYDFDVLGNRSATFYCWGATVFALVKEGGFEVDEQNPNQENTIRTNGLQDEVVGARILPVSRNLTTSLQIRTIQITIDPAVSPSRDRCIPIPPGTRRVQVFSNNPDPSANGFEVRFLFGRVAPATRADLGDIEFIPGLSRTNIVSVPNAPQLGIRPTDAGAPVTGFSAVFEVEPS